MLPDWFGAVIVVVPVPFCKFTVATSLPLSWIVPGPFTPGSGLPDAPRACTSIGMVPPSGTVVSYCDDLQDKLDGNVHLEGTHASLRGLTAGGTGHRRPDQVDSIRAHRRLVPIPIGRRDLVVGGDRRGIAVAIGVARRLRGDEAWQGSPRYRAGTTCTVAPETDDPEINPPLFWNTKLKLYGTSEAALESVTFGGVERHGQRVGADVDLRRRGTGGLAVGPGDVNRHLIGAGCLVRVRPLDQDVTRRRIERSARCWCPTNGLSPQLIWA